MKRSEIPCLDDLRAFEAVVRLGSVRGAADELALTHGAVSRRVSKLAAALGLQLMEPSGRGVRPTGEGARLAAAAKAGFIQIEGALDDIRSASGTAPIVLSCERSLAMRWLIPRLSGFQDKYRHVDVHLSTGGGGLDFSRERVSLAIRRLDFPVDPDWMVIRIAREQVGPVLLPSLKEKFFNRDYVALGSRTRPDAWARWLRGNPDAPAPSKTQLFDHHFLMIEAACAGLGVAIAPQLMVASDVDLGRLDAPLGFMPDGTDYVLLAPRGGKMSAEAAALKAWLLNIAPEDGLMDSPPSATA